MNLHLDYEYPAAGRANDIDPDEMLLGIEQPDFWDDIYGIGMPVYKAATPQSISEQELATILGHSFNA